jgi:ABC-2 type transport system permease protein
MPVRTKSLSLGFDAVNSEQNKGTLSRILSQPIHRDYLLNAKFPGALIVMSVMFFALGCLVMVTGLIAATIICFVISYTSFMRREIRSR